MPAPTRPPRTYRGVTRSERDAARRARLIDAGLETFGTQGYPASSVESLCSAAGVSTRNFYDHFGNREALLIAVYDAIVADAQARLVDALQAVERDAPIGNWALAGITAFTDVMLRDPRRARVNFVEVVGASQTVELHRRAVLGQFAALLHATIASLVQTGRLTPRSPAVTRVQVAVLIGGVQETLTDWLADPERLRGRRRGART